VSEQLLSGKVALVTGAGSGLGRAHAEHLASLGASVLVNDLGEAAAKAATEIADQFGVATASYDGDIGSIDGGQAVVDTALEALGRLDIVVNNAGIVRDKMIFSMDEAAWDDVIRVHGKGTFAVCRAASAYFRTRSKSGDESPASIINTASEAGLFGNVGQANYTFAKGGIVALSLTVHQEMQKYGVRCNVVCPRARTAMLANLALPEAEQGAADPLDPAHVAPLVAFLASDRSAPISGQVFVAYGGKVQHVRPPSWGEALVVRDRQIEFSDIEQFAHELFSQESPMPVVPRHQASISTWSQGGF
jgi:3-oxoacyl-[acyl-carrier protein] reductase